MKKPFRAGAIVIAGIILSVSFAPSARTLIRSQASGTPQSERTMTAHAKGNFDVKLTPQPSDDKSADSTIARWTLDKQFHGVIEGTSKGQMIGASTDVKGSAGYVAMERVTGTLAGRTGSFTLQHSGTMTRGAFHLEITVVPDSGTGQLTGLTGLMSIQVVSDGKHSYDFAYSLPKPD
jgi:Protein of unknown function (DUF3224)